MAVSKAQQRATNKYKKTNYDRMELIVPKGQKDIVRDHAAARGESVNGFIGRAISEAMERDSGGTASETAGKRPESTTGAGTVSLPSETLEAAQAAAEAAGEGLPQFVARAIETQAQRDKVARGLKR